MEAFPEDITRQDFLQSGWEAVVAGCKEPECEDYWFAFGKKATELIEAGDERQGRIHMLLCQLTSMPLNLDRPLEPFRPRWSTPRGERSLGPDDLDENSLNLIASVVPDVGDPELQARLADLLTLRRRNYRTADLAVTAYLASAKKLEAPDRWPPMVDRVVRALQIAASFGKRAQSFPRVIAYIEAVLAQLDGEDPLFLSARLMELLQAHRVGDHAAEHAQRAAKQAERAEASAEWHRARTYWQVTATWFRILKQPTEERAAVLREADTHVKQAEAAVAGDTPSYMHASGFLTFGIEAYRKVGNTDEEVQRLVARLLDYQARSTAELIPYGASLDISEWVAQAEKHVQGKPLEEALLALAFIADPHKVSALRAKVEENRRTFIFHRIMPEVRLNVLGRVIARQPESEDEALQADMDKDLTRFHSVHVQAIVEPARTQILSEHAIGIRDILPLVHNNPFVQPGAEYIVARALHAGLTGDFLVAVHLLTPQLEASLRHLLSRAGVIATGFDAAGIQNEGGLNGLLVRSEYTGPLTRLLGEDFVFHLRCLLISHWGANLRNDTSHGLLDHDSFYSAPACYLWWLSLRFYLLPVLGLTKQRSGSGEASQAETRRGTRQVTVRKRPRTG